MKVVDKQAVTVVKKLWNAVADNSRIPKLINSVSQQLPKRSSNNFNMPLFDVRNPRWTQVHTRKQPILKPFRFFPLRCTCSFGILITVGILIPNLSSNLKTSHVTEWSKRFECLTNTGNHGAHFISWGHLWTLLLSARKSICGTLHWSFAVVKIPAAHDVWKIRSYESKCKLLEEKMKEKKFDTFYTHFHHNNLLHQK